MIYAYFKISKHTEKCKECKSLLKFHHPQGITLNILVNNLQSFLTEYTCVMQ